MRWLRGIAAALWLPMLPGAGWGADLNLGLVGSVEYDDNVIRTSSGEQDDFVFRVMPQLRLLEEEGKLRWNLGYQVAWEKAVDTPQIDGFRHFADAGFQHHFNERTQVFFRDGFS